MKFKEPKLEAELESVSVVLQQIIEDFAFDSEYVFGIEPVVTRVLDPVEGESGVHGDKRGVDLRDEHSGVCLYTKEQAASLVKWVNDKWKRNDGKVTCLHHSFNGGPLHFHFQIPISTKVYEP